YIWLIHIAPETEEGYKYKTRAIKFFEDQRYFSQKTFHLPPFLGNEDTIDEMKKSSDKLLDLALNKPKENQMDNVYVITAALTTLISEIPDDGVSSILVKALT